MFVCAPCQVTLTLSSFYGLPSTKGGGLYEGAELDSVTIKALGTTELNLKDLSTMVQTKASSKVDQVQLLVSHAHRSDARTIEHGTEDMYIQVHLPDGGTTMIKLPATTSMGEMLYHIADKRSLEIGSFEMAAKKNGKKMLSLQGTIGQNNVKEVFCLKKKGYKAKSLDSLSSTSSLMRTSSADVDSSVQKLTSLLAEGVSFDDPRIPAIWTQFITTANITEAVMRDPGQRQQVFNIVENHGGVRNIVEMPPRRSRPYFLTCLISANKKPPWKTQLLHLLESSTVLSPGRHPPGLQTKAARGARWRQHPRNSSVPRKTSLHYCHNHSLHSVVDPAWLAK